MSLPTNPMNFQTWHFQGTNQNQQLDCLHSEVLWRKSGGLFSSLSVQWWVTALHWRQSIHIHWRGFRDTGKTRWKEEDRCLKKWVRIVALYRDINFINLLWRCLVSKIKLINTWRNQFTTVCFTMCCENKKFLSLALDTCLWNHSDYHPIYFHGKRIKCFYQWWLFQSWYCQRGFTFPKILGMIYVTSEQSCNYL